jgi:predicted DCC family thiol-disulfide oxidoreductase YuxK
MRRAAYPIKIFYDGSCIVCSTEMEHYRQKDAKASLIFIDITAPDFRPETYGKSREELMRKLHVLDAEGRYYKGADGFPPIWRGLPPERTLLALAWLIEKPLVNQIAKACYFIFARLRRFLPKRRKCAACRMHL